MAEFEPLFSEAEVDYYGVMRCFYAWRGPIVGGSIHKMRYDARRLRFVERWFGPDVDDFKVMRHQALKRVRMIARDGFELYGSATPIPPWRLRITNGAN